MKTIDSLKTIVSTLTEEINEASKVDGKDKKAYARARRKMTINRKKIQFTSFCIKYIETKPAEDFLKHEQARLENRINKFFENYKELDPERFKKSEITAHKKSFEKEMGIPKIRKQLSCINFLLAK